MHRMVDEILDGVANGVTGFINSATNSIKGAGKSVMRGLDKPFHEMTGKEGPHRLVDRAADSTLDAGVNLINQGVIGTARTVGKGAMRVLDHPLEQFKGDGGKFKLPWRKK